METGVFRDMPAEEYHALHAIGSSPVKAMAVRSAAHAKLCLDGDVETTDALMIGDACDAALLTPDIFAEQYAIGPDVKLNTKDGKAEWAAFADANVGKKLIRGGDAETINGVRSAVWAHPFASRILLAASDAQLSGVWTDAETGLPCKFRLDLYCKDIGIFIDLKTTRAESPEQFKYQARSLGYPIQLAHYRAGMLTVGLPCAGAYLIAVTKKRPFICTVFEASEPTLVEAEIERMKALKKIVKCQASNHWPGYSEGVETI